MRKFFVANFDNGNASANPTSDSRALAVMDFWIER